MRGSDSIQRQQFRLYHQKPITPLPRSIVQYVLFAVVGQVNLT